MWFWWVMVVLSVWSSFSRAMVNSGALPQKTVSPGVAIFAAVMDLGAAAFIFYWAYMWLVDHPI